MKECQEPSGCCPSVSAMSYGTSVQRDKLIGFVFLRLFIAWTALNKLSRDSDNLFVFSHIHILKVHLPCKPPADSNLNSIST